MIGKLLASAVAALTFAMAAPLQAQAQGQDYPNHLIKIYQGFPPGGNVDLIARILGAEMEKSLGQSIVVEAKPGLAGALAAETVARSDPDGYTLLVVPSAHPAYGALAKNVKFKVVDDFTWISVASFYPFMIAVKADSRFKTIKQLLDEAKAKPGELKYGSAGVGSSAHLGCVMLEQAIGAKFQHVPYRGTGPAMQDLIAGRIDFLCDIAVTAVQAIGNGNVKALANLSSTRSPVLPDLPTAAEKGLPTVAAYTWAALFVPKNTPEPVVTKLNSAVLTAMDGKGLREQLESVAATMVAPERRTPAYAATFVKSEWDKWGAAIRAGGAIPQ